VQLSLATRGQRALNERDVSLANEDARTLPHRAKAYCLHFVTELYILLRVNENGGGVSQSELTLYT